MNEAIEFSARQLAQAEEALQAAHQRHQEATAEVGMLEERLQAVTARRERIRVDLASGSLSDREAGGLLAAVDEDLADLHRLVDEARARATAAVPAAEQRAFDMARLAVERIGRENLFAALLGRVLELERAFLAALGALCQQGEALGRGRYVSSVFVPSETLRRALWSNVPPPPPAAVVMEQEDE